MQNISLIAYEPTKASDRVEGAIIAGIGDEKDISDGAFGYVKMSLN